MLVRDDINLSDIVEIFRLDEEKDDVMKVCDLDNPKEIADAISELSYRTKVILLEAAFSIQESKRAQTIIDELRKLNMVVFEIDNQDLVKRTFAKFRQDVVKYRNRVTYIDKLLLFVLTYLPLEDVQEYFDDLKVYASDRKDPSSQKKITKTVNRIEDVVKKSITHDITYVHALFSIEPHKTQYKRTLHVTGLMRCYNNDTSM